MNKVKQTLIAVAMIVVLASCGSEKKAEDSNKEDYGTPDETAAPVASVDVIAQGESLVKAGDCKTCHHPTNKIIGPSHTEVAKKYEFTQASVTLLATKIISGGTGVWGEIPMTPHPDITQADAEKMARYVLSLDGEKEH
jgi:cytochrome c